MFKSNKKNPSGEVLVVSSKVKNYLKDKGMRSAGDLPEALSVEVQKLLDRAIQRAKEHNKQTVGPRDI